MLHFNIRIMTNEEKIKKANELIKEVLLSEFNNTNFNKNSLKHLDQITAEHIVNYWYLAMEQEVFLNDNGEELDEFLCIEEIKERDFKFNSPIID